MKPREFYLGIRKHDLAWLKTILGLILTTYFQLKFSQTTKFI